MELSYLIRVLGGTSFKKLNGVIDQVHEITGKSKASILFDILHCARKYGAGYYDYKIFAFYNLSEAQRATFVTRTVNRKVNVFFNDSNYTHIFNNKDEFNKTFAKYIRRRWLVIPESSKEEIEQFVQGKEEVFVKIRDGESSIGTERIKMADYPTFDAFYQHLMDGGFCMLEDIVDQHEDLNRLHPGSVNCMRIITLVDDDGVPHCLCAVQKMGKGDSYVDCYCLFAPVDFETGCILYPAHTGDTPLGTIYEEHPDTHIKLVGYRIPYAPEAIAMCLEAAKVVPQIRYVGWDVAITKDGPEFIEGNMYCAHDFWQLPPHTPDGIGMLPTIMKYAKDFRR